MATKTVIVEFDARLKKLEQGFKRAEKKTNKFKGVLKKVGAALAAAFAVQKVVQFTREVIELGNELDKVAMRFGATVDQAVRLELFTRQAKINMSVMDDIAQETGKKIDEALNLGSKDMQKAFARVGLDPKQLKDLDTLDRTMRVLQALASVDNATERAGLADKLLGGGAAKEAAPLINDAERLEQILENTQRFKNPLTGDNLDPKRLREMSDRWEEIKLSVQLIGLQLVNKALPVLQQMYEWVTANGEAFKIMWDAVKGVASFLWETFKTLGQVIGEAFAMVYVGVDKAISAIGRFFKWLRPVFDRFSIDLGFDPDAIGQRFAAQTGRAPQPRQSFNMEAAANTPMVVNQNITVQGANRQQLETQLRQKAESARRAGQR